MYKAQINVTLRKSILDPKGKAAREALHNLGYNQVQDVRIGKYIEVLVKASDRAAAEKTAREACEKLLANEVMEDFTIDLTEIES